MPLRLTRGGPGRGCITLCVGVIHDFSLMGCIMAFERSLLERVAHPELENYHVNTDFGKMSDSVLRHLFNMLNVRQDSASINPDYGLPDFNDLVSRFPDAFLELTRAIRTCIEKYEPRLQNVRVQHVPDKGNAFELRFEINANLEVEGQKSRVWYETTMDPTGKAKVRR